ncbi:MAG: ATP-binding protein [Candidatus Sulfotelmatobacter sp.]
MDRQRDINFVTSARLGGHALIALGLSVLVGWAANVGPLMTVLPGRIAMKPNAAIGFLFAGVALVLLTRVSNTRQARIASAVGAGFVVLIGLLTVIEYIFHWDLGIDQLLFRDLVQHYYPGRMAHISALNFCLTGTSLLLLSISEKQARWPQLLSLLSGFSATLAIIGYLYGVPVLYGSVEYTSMALHTGLGFLILSAAIIHCRPTLGLMQVISSRHAGGWLARRLLPIAVIAPALLGAVYVHGRFSHWDVRLALASLIVAQIVLFVGLVWALAFLLNRLEAEKTAAQTALQHSEKLLEQRYRTMFEEAIVGIFQSTPEGRFLSVNPAMALMLGYASPAEMMAAVTDIPNQLYVDRKRSDEFKSLIEQQGAVQNFEIQMYRKDGTQMWMSSNIRAAYEDGAIVRYEGTNSDITERKLLQGQLAQAQKMEAVGRLAGGVAHDFNNAIGVIVGYSALLKDRVPTDEKALQYTEQISKAGHRAASLTRQLLAFSRKQVIQPIVLDLNTVVSDTEKMLRRLIGEDIKMMVSLGRDLRRIKADRGQLEQILMNLAVNARDAMPQGGKLIIETHNAELDKTAVAQHSYAKPGEYVVLSVSDTGCGMDKETLAHIFEPFFTTKGLGKGTGLGLSTVYGIVKQSEGYVWVYSELGKGARFKIYWPRTTKEAQALAPLSEPLALPTGSETILLVEDDDSMRELTRNCLASVGYTILSTPDGEAAIRVASQQDGPIQLLLTDVVMPGLSGRQLAESLAAYRPEMKVLYMSGYTADLIADHGVLESNIALLEKPFTQEALLNNVRRVLDGDHQARTAIAGR